MTPARLVVALAALRERRHRAADELENTMTALDRFATPALQRKRDNLAAIIVAIDTTLAGHGIKNDSG